MSSLTLSGATRACRVQDGRRPKVVFISLEQTIQVIADIRRTWPEIQSCSKRRSSRWLT